MLEAYVQGFAFLEEEPSNLVNAKNATPVMSRTSLFDLYEKTPHKEVIDGYIRQHFLEKQTLARQREEQTLAGQKKKQWNKVSVGDWSKQLEKYKSDRATKDPLSRFDGMSQLSNSDSESLDPFGIAASTDISMGDQ